MRLERAGRVLSVDEGRGGRLRKMDTWLVGRGEEGKGGRGVGGGRRVKKMDTWLMGEGKAREGGKG